MQNLVGMTHCGAQSAIAALLQDYAKMVENTEPQLADVVLLVEGERFPAHRCVIAARSEYFRGLLLSGMPLKGGGRGVGCRRSSWGK